MNVPHDVFQMDMDTAVAVFTQTLQQFANSLQGQVSVCVSPYLLVTQVAMM